MTINKNKVIMNFSRHALRYDTYAIVQKEMALEFINIIKEKKEPFVNILEIGAGTGFLTKLLCEKFPHSSILATDISEAMLTVARRNLSIYPNVMFKQLDGENLNCNKEEFDLIVSNAVIQWFNNYENTFTSYLKALKQGGYMMSSTFGEGTFQELRFSLQIALQNLGIVSSTFPGQDLLNKDKLRDYLIFCGFSQVKITEDYRLMKYNTVTQLFESIKNTGAGNATGNRVFHNAKLTSELIRCYGSLFRKDGQIPTTYHKLFAEGRK
ncbi:MAG: malonyl-ACP O-methyltransferase BioC [bacterium]|nr:malonyl-ACP O-methyltransferase BioC [bacterium]